jgi:hypothetical protein
MKPVDRHSIQGVFLRCVLRRLRRWFMPLRVITDAAITAEIGAANPNVFFGQVENEGLTRFGIPRLGANENACSTETTRLASSLQRKVARAFSPARI